MRYDTTEGKRHTNTAAVKIWRAQTDFHKEHQDQKFCMATRQAMESVAKGPVIEGEWNYGCFIECSETVSCMQELRSECSIFVKFIRQIQDLATEFSRFCESCKHSFDFLNSKCIKEDVNNKSNNIYNVNIRLTYGMRCIGKGKTSAKILCGMNCCINYAHCSHKCDYSELQ